MDEVQDGHKSCLFRSPAIRPTKSRRQGLTSSLGLGGGTDHQSGGGPPLLGRLLPHAHGRPHGLQAADSGKWCRSRYRRAGDASGCLGRHSVTTNQSLRPLGSYMSKSVLLRNVCKPNGRWHRALSITMAADLAGVLGTSVANPKLETLYILATSSICETPICEVCNSYCRSGACSTERGP